MGKSPAEQLESISKPQDVPIDPELRNFIMAVGPGRRRPYQFMNERRWGQHCPVRTRRSGIDTYHLRAPRPVDRCARSAQKFTTRGCCEVLRCCDDQHGRLTLSLKLRIRTRGTTKPCELIHNPPSSRLEGQRITSRYAIAQNPDQTQCRSALWSI